MAKRSHKRSLPKADYISPDGSVQLYHADCMDILKHIPDDRFDAVMTSPPYNTLPSPGTRASGMYTHNNWVNKAADGDHAYEDDMPEDEYQKWLLGVLEECRRCCRGLVWVNHKIRYRDGEALHPARIFPWPIYTEVIWDRACSMALNCSRYAPSTEHLLAFGKPVCWNNELNKLLSVWRIKRENSFRAYNHPCAFPILLAQRPIQSSTPTGGVVLDPFMGSGTTAVACIRLGRLCIGVEKDRKFFDAAVARIEDAVRMRSSQLFKFCATPKRRLPDYIFKTPQAKRRKT